MSAEPRREQSTQEPERPPGPGPERSALALARRTGIALLLAALLGMSLLYFVASRRFASQAEGRAEGTAIAIAQDAAKNRAAMEQWAKGRPNVKTARIVNIDDRTIEASTFPDDRKNGDLPRRMVREEKPLFDLGQTLRTNIETNAQESAHRKEEVIIERRPGGSLLVAAPFSVDGTVAGYAQVLIAGSPVAEPAPSFWIALAFAFAPFIAFVAISPLLKARAAEGGGAPLSIAAVLLLISLFAYRQYVLVSLDPGQRVAVVNPGYAIALASLALLLFVGLGIAARMREAISENRQAYLYVVPAMFGMIVLVFFPFLYGVTLSFTSQNIYSINKPLNEIWIGVRNYIDILAGGGRGYQSFYWTLFFTICWTVVNVAMGVTIGLVLALALNTKGLRMKGAYRVLLILPWAMPNYITALIWKGMFHQQFGVINQVIQIFGGHAISWFTRPLTSFMAVCATNIWLSFPFMMVVTLGALQSIPMDLYEAARVDGATRWQQFTRITLPSLKPALIPAIILSVVWTFNMFNIIYLVSAGEPAGSTEILITQAYKIAFEQYRYGYAAAYSTVIFGILLVYGIFQNRITRATEAIAG
ncbi:MAG: carbohydrate ABC transporter permease [Thermoanaerobaculia bacterium]